MRKNIHPKLFDISVTCSCGNNFNLSLAFKSDKLKLEVCNKCHPFFTGKQKIIDVAGRVDGFYKKFAKLNISGK